MPNVAVIGASSDRNKFGNKAVRAFLQRGYTVFPVHPTEPEVEGLAAFRAVTEVPADLDIVSVYVPPAVLLGLLPAIAEKGCRELWLNPGTDSEAVLDKAESLRLNIVAGCGILRIGVSPAAL